MVWYQSGQYNKMEGIWILLRTLKLDGRELTDLRPRGSLFCNRQIRKFEFGPRSMEVERTRGKYEHRRRSARNKKWPHFWRSSKENYNHVSWLQETLEEMQEYLRSTRLSQAINYPVSCLDWWSSYEDVNRSDTSQFSIFSLRVNPANN